MLVFLCLIFESNIDTHYGTVKVSEIRKLPISIKTSNGVEVSSSSTGVGDSITGFFEFDGDSNTFTIQGDPTNTYGIDNSNYNVDVTGSTNTFTLDHGTTALAATLDLDWIDSCNVKEETNYLKWITLEKPLTIQIDGSSGQSIILKYPIEIDEIIDEDESSGI